ncbi:eukaryotic translation initiation factor 2C 1 [Trichinella spiralis]|uniref:eukaryotic translation initiation factor 2C 1 n=1 Tax=Trichinella spiralis TaxID=6334 RepID=UPI0001EFE405|nr:eukaryotic translation initiation factor 2C 1 [Trichinella spiralis]
MINSKTANNCSDSNGTIFDVSHEETSTNSSSQSNAPITVKIDAIGEDVNVAADELSQLRLKELVKRPGYGTVGKPIKLACNYFPLIKLQKGDIVVNRYHIDIQHPRLNDDNRDVFWAYVVKRSDIFGDPF